MYQKNVAGQVVGFVLLSTTTGNRVLGATVTAYRTVDDNPQELATGTIVEQGNGQYILQTSAADMNGNTINFLFTATGAISVNENVVTYTDPNSEQAPGNFPSGSVGYNIGKLGGTQVVVVPSMTQGGNISIIQGDSYYAADGRAFQWSDNTWPDLTGATAVMTVFGDDGTIYTHAVEIQTPGSGTQTLQVEFSNSDTATPIPSGYFKITVTLASGHNASLVDAYCTSEVV